MFKLIYSEFANVTTVNTQHSFTDLMFFATRFSTGESSSGLNLTNNA
jgi:hypothetical protein